MRAPAPALSATTDQITELTRLSRSRTSPQRVVQRAKIILLAARGVGNAVIARELRITRPTVLTWRARFSRHGVTGILKDAPRPGRKPRISAEKRAAILRGATREKPKDATHWSTRTLARRHAVSHMSVHRLLREHDLKPHLTRKFKVSRDPNFESKVIDIIGLYRNPPEHAVAICVDEKTQVQALDRTQPGLPMKPGRAGTMTHDYKRHGTTALYAGLDLVSGRVLAQCHPRHRHQEFLQFMRLIEKSVPADKSVHLVLDNSSTHKTPEVKAWLARHPRYTLHFTPTSGSWLNLVERFFAEITRKRIRRGVFHSVAELVEAILAYVETHNQNPKPYVWKSPAQAVIAKVRKCKEVLVTDH